MSQSSAAFAVNPAETTAGPLELPPEPTQQAAFDRHLPEAQALAASEVRVARVDLDLVFRNAVLIVAALRPFEARLAQLPDVRPDLLERFRELALATLFAGRRAARTSGEELTPVDLARLRRLRQLLLRSLEAAALAELVPEESVDAIVAGRGNLDAAQDCVDLVALYEEHAAALANRTPLTPAVLAEATALAHRAREAHAIAGHLGAIETDDRQRAADERDRLWTLLLAADEEIRRVAGFVFGTASSRKVPSLQSRQGWVTPGAREKTPVPAEPPQA